MISYILTVQNFHTLQLSSRCAIRRGNTQTHSDAPNKCW